MEQLIRHVKPAKAIAPIYATTNHATTATVVDGRGFNRAMWVIMTGTMLATAKLTGKIQNSATSSGTYTDVTSAALVDVTSTGASKIFIIDHKINGSYPYLKFKGTSSTSRLYVGGACILYNGSRLKPGDPDTNTAQIVALS